MSAELEFWFGFLKELCECYEKAYELRMISEKAFALKILDKELTFSIDQDTDILLYKTIREKDELDQGDCQYEGIAIGTFLQHYPDDLIVGLAEDHKHGITMREAQGDYACPFCDIKPSHNINDGLDSSNVLKIYQKHFRQYHEKMKQTPNKKVVLTFKSSGNDTKPHRMTSKERHEFIEWMFDEFESFDHSKSFYQLAKEIVERYRRLKNVQMTVDWVNTLFKYGICKYDDGTYGFQDEAPVTLEEMCSNPSAYRSKNKK